MNKLAFAFLIGTALLHHTTAIAEDRAVNVSIGGTGGGVDSASLQKVRKVIGKGFADGAADTVYVYTPREGDRFSSKVECLYVWKRACFRHRYNTANLNAIT
jgi:hypothetical protein